MKQGQIARTATTRGSRGGCAISRRLGLGRFRGSRVALLCHPPPPGYPSVVIAAVGPLPPAALVSCSSYLPTCGLGDTLTGDQLHAGDNWPPPSARSHPPPHARQDLLWRAPRPPWTLPNLLNCLPGVISPRRRVSEPEASSRRVGHAGAGVCTCVPQRQRRLRSVCELHG